MYVYVEPLFVGIFRYVEKTPMILNEGTPVPSSMKLAFNEM
jgi:hypothetical protein